MNITDKDIWEWIAKAIAAGHIIPHDDGTFTLGPELAAKTAELLDEKPELFSQIFPDRVN